MSEIYSGGERELLEAMLEKNRDALLDAVRGLTEEDARRRLVPSLTAPITLVKHCAAVERIWFQRTVGRLGRDECDGYAVGDDASWAVGEDETLAEVIAEYQAARVRSNRIAAEHLDLDAEVAHYRRGPVSLRWVYLHMIEELARHAGHADILVEQTRA